MSSFVSSMQYTIGTALDRAREQGHRVQILTEGQWLEGRVLATDGIGVVVEHGEEDHAIIRLERVSAVRVKAAAPLTAGGRPDVVVPVEDLPRRTVDGAFPMPAPREASG